MTVAEQIESKLQQAFNPLHLEVVNESHMHSVPPGSESHFKITLVSEQFAGLMLIKQHRLVNTTLKTELSGQIHALALHTYTPEKWFARAGQSPQSPPCEGGSKA